MYGGDNPPFEKVKIVLIPYALAVIGLTFGSLYFGVGDLLGIPEALIFIGGLAALVVGSFLVWSVLLYKHLDNTAYRIEPEGIEIVHEFIHHSKNLVRFDEITDVEMEQPISMRVFGTGNIVLNTAGSKEKSFKLRFVESPEELQQALSEEVSGSSYAGSEVV